MRIPGISKMRRQHRASYARAARLSGSKRQRVEMMADMAFVHQLEMVKVPFKFDKLMELVKSNLRACPQGATGNQGLKALCCLPRRGLPASPSRAHSFHMASGSVR